MHVRASREEGAREWGKTDDFSSYDRNCPWIRSSPRAQEFGEYQRRLCKFFNPDPDDTALEALQNCLEVLKRASMNRLSYKDVLEGHDSKNHIYDYQKLFTCTK